MEENLKPAELPKGFGQTRGSEHADLCHCGHFNFSDVLRSCDNKPIEYARPQHLINSRMLPHK